MPKVSIIIPVYKAEETIAACLDSVTTQTLDNLEVLMVNDHTCDGSIDIAQQHLKQYSGPIRFIFLETDTHGSPGAARNLGIEKATGDYLAFLDSDDTLDSVFCEKLYSAAIQEKADLAFGHISIDQADGYSVIKRNPPVTNGSFVGKAKQQYLRQFISYFTTYLYRRDFLVKNNIRFPNTHSAEDSCFLICSLLSAQRITSIDKALYHYHVHALSISQKRDPQRWRNRLDSFRAMKQFAQQNSLYRPYRNTINWIILKKGWLMAAKDFYKNNLKP